MKKLLRRWFWKLIYKKFVISRVKIYTPPLIAYPLLIEIEMNKGKKFEELGFGKFTDYLVKRADELKDEMIKVITHAFNEEKQIKHVASELKRWQDKEIANLDKLIEKEIKN